MSQQSIERHDGLLVSGILPTIMGATHTYEGPGSVGMSW